MSSTYIGLESKMANIGRIGMGDLDVSIDEIAYKLKDILQIWDGKSAILKLKAANYQWRQMEWIGWYFEHLCRTQLKEIMSIPGPRHGNVGFDGLTEIPWDFKAHSEQAGNQVIVNDTEATEWAIENYGAVGLILAHGSVMYDEDGSFKIWHDELKGMRSDYEETRIREGRPSRRRKTRFDLKKIDIIRLDTSNARFQEGMRNADGSPRRPKVLLNLRDIGPMVVRSIIYGGENSW
jgi:hypothetical protein